MVTAGSSAHAGDGATAGLSRWMDIDGPVHYLDFGGPPAAPAMVCVHGLGGSAVNWLALAPLLTGTHRVLAPDLAGHGFTQAQGRGTGVAPNRALLHRFIEAVPGSPAILVGNSMGGMISLLEASAAPETVAALVLLGPALPFVPAWPDPLAVALFAVGLSPGASLLLAARRRRVRPEDMVATTLALCCADPARVPARVRAEHAAVARRRAGFAGVDRDFTRAFRSVATAVRTRAYRRGVRRIRCPVLLIHGDRDRLVPVAVARATARANPSWSLVVMPGVGHVPQLEVPAQTAGVATAWLGPGGTGPAR
jgi:pimeloyl-ACP methyl ester carboxylesterase